MMVMVMDEGKGEILLRSRKVLPEELHKSCHDRAETVKSRNPHSEAKTSKGANCRLAKSHLPSVNRTTPGHAALQVQSRDSESINAHSDLGEM